MAVAAGGEPLTELPEVLQVGAAQMSRVDEPRLPGIRAIRIRVHCRKGNVSSSGSQIWKMMISCLAWRKWARP